MYLGGRHINVVIRKLTSGELRLKYNYQGREVGLGRCVCVCVCVRTASWQAIIKELLADLQPPQEKKKLQGLEKFFVQKKLQDFESFFSIIRGAKIVPVQYISE